MIRNNKTQETPNHQNEGVVSGSTSANAPNIYKVINNKKQSKKLILVVNLASVFLGGAVQTLMGIHTAKHRLKKAAESSEASFQLANQESFSFFYDIPQYQWQMYKEVYSAYQPHKYASDDPRQSGGKNGAVFYQENYEPNFSCPFELRIGMNGDGGKWICGIKHIVKQAQDKKNMDE